MSVRFNADSLLSLYEQITYLQQDLRSFKHNSHHSPQQLNGLVQKYQTLSIQVTDASGGRGPLNVALEVALSKITKLQRQFGQSVIPMASSRSPVQEISHRARTQGIIQFYDGKTDALTAVFGNFYPCSFEYGSRRFGNAESVFQAQKFTDQPQIMQQFTQNTTGDQAVALARGNAMTSKRLLEWDGNTAPDNKVNVMMNVLRAKFGQNPQLKEMLLATNNAYLVEHLPDANRRDRFWSDGFDGTGSNMLGILLMRLRAEYGGVGEVARPSQQVSHPPVQPLPLCQRCHVRPVYVDSTTQRVHDYCGRTCAQLAGAL